MYIINTSSRVSIGLKPNAAAVPLCPLSPPVIPCQLTMHTCMQAQAAQATHVPFSCYTRLHFLGFRARAQVCIRKLLADIQVHVCIGCAGCVVRVL